MLDNGRKNRNDQGARCSTGYAGHAQLSSALIAEAEPVGYRSTVLDCHAGHAEFLTHSSEGAHCSTAGGTGTTKERGARQGTPGMRSLTLRTHPPGTVSFASDL